MRLLRKVVKHILAEPLRLEMADYVIPIDKAIVKEEPETFPKCGTQGCIAGWTVMLNDTKTQKQRWNLVDKSPEFLFDRAQKLLGLTSDEAHRLFLEWNYRVGASGAMEVKDKVAALIAARKEGRAWVLEYN